MYNEAQRGKQHDTGAWGDKPLPSNYHHAIQVRYNCSITINIERCVVCAHCEYNVALQHMSYGDVMVD